MKPENVKLELVEPPGDYASFVVSWKYNGMFNVKHFTFVTEDLKEKMQEKATLYAKGLRDGTLSEKRTEIEF